MHQVRGVGLASVALFVVGLVCAPAALGASAVEELTKRLPDDVIAFVGTSGGDALKGDFEKTIISRIWNDKGVRTFYQSVKTELLAKAKQESGDPNVAQKIDLVLSYVRLALSRPVVIGIMPRPSLPKAPPITAFGILDAGDRKAQLVEIMSKLEAMVGQDDIRDKKIGSLTLQATEDSDGVLVYWGWAGDRFIIAANDAPEAAVKYLSQPRSTVPAWLGRVPGDDDALVVYGDIRRIGQLFGSFLHKEGAESDMDTLWAVLKGLGLGEIRSFTLRAGFVGADVSTHAVVEMPSPAAGILGAFKPVDPSWFEAIDARAMMANAIHCDLGAVYDTILSVVKTVSPDKAYPEFQHALSRFESQAGLRIREELLASLAGPMVVYSLPAGAVPEAPAGGGAILARLRDAALFEKFMAALGKFVMEKAEGQLQVGSLKRDDGRTVHVWTAGPAAMMGVMPTWSIADDHLVLGFNMEMHDLAAKRFTSKEPDANSLLDTEEYKKAGSSGFCVLLS